MKTLIDNTTDAKTSNPHFPYESQGQFAIIQQGLSGNEVVTIEYSLNNTTWSPLYQYGYKVELSATNSAVGVYAPCFLRVVKGITTNPVTVVLQDKIHQGS